MGGALATTSAHAAPPAEKATNAPSPLDAPPIGPRWPTWPTEIAVLAASFEPGGRHSEDERYATLLALDEYPTAAIATTIAKAIDDPATSVQRQAMGMCVARRILACQAPAARHALAKDAELSTRVRALEVLALDATPTAWTDILVQAVDDPLPGLQLAALGLVGLAPMDPTRTAALTLRLRAKLADPDPEIRAASCRALGLRGDELALPVLLAALDDPDPVVIEAAVEAIAALGHPGALPALARLLDDTTTPALQRKVIVAIAALPGRDAELVLLDRLRPSSETVRDWIVRAAATRSALSDAMLRDVASLLRDPDLHGPALKLLAEHGARAHPVLRDVLTAGVEPSLAAAIGDILVASQTVTARSSKADPPASGPSAGTPDLQQDPRWEGLAPRSGASSDGLAAPWPGDATHSPSFSWLRAVNAMRGGVPNVDRARLQVTIDDALVAGLPPASWIEAAWTLLLTTSKAPPSRGRAPHHRRWTKIAAAALEGYVRDAGAAPWLRCTAWATLVTPPSNRKLRAASRALGESLAADPNTPPSLLRCVAAWTPPRGSSPLGMARRSP